MQDYTVTIKRNAQYNFLFDLIDYIGQDYIGYSFEDIQKIIGIESENFAGYDDYRYLMII